MEKKDLLKFCRYYKGEKENPFEGKDQMKALMWGYESKWVEFTMKASEDDKCQEAQILSSSLNEYIRAGMREFEKTDDTPLSLKALLFNRYCHWNSGSMIECVEPFKEFYKNDYKREKAAD